MVTHKFYFIFPSEWLSAKIVKALGPRIWLLLYFMNKVTHTADGVGLVLGGQPMSFEDISAELQVHRNTVARQYAHLEKFGFVGSKKVWGGPRKFFVIGYSKFPKRKQSTQDEKRFEFAYYILREQINLSTIENEDTIINPNFQEVLTNLSLDDSAPPQKGDEVSKIETPITNSGASITNKKAREESSIRKRKGKKRKREIPPTSGKPKEVPVEVAQVYDRYMILMGSRSENPTAQETLLIREAIKAEGLDKMLTCIENYRKRLNDRKTWTVLSVEKFFQIKTYSRFLRTDHTQTAERKKLRPLKEFE